jgi:hypothetical protein
MSLPSCECGTPSPGLHDIACPANTTASHDGCEPECSYLEHTPTCPVVHSPADRDKKDLLDSMEELCKVLEAGDPDGPIALFIRRGNGEGAYVRFYALLRQHGRAP